MLQDMVRTSQKWRFGKRDVDGFSSFIIDFQLFYFLARIIPNKINVREKIKNGQSRETDNIEH